LDMGVLAVCVRLLVCVSCVFVSMLGVRVCVCAACVHALAWTSAPAAVVCAWRVSPRPGAGGRWAAATAPLFLTS
jgi:hypothetical protein